MMPTDRMDHFHHLPNGPGWQDGHTPMPMVRPGPMQPMPWAPRPGLPISVPSPGGNTGFVPPSAPPPAPGTGRPLPPIMNMPLSIPGGPPPAPGAGMPVSPIMSM